VSDFGFDAYALDDAEPIGHPHPLEIARDLIATGKPHAALEMLSLHHDQLADDPEYLLLCSEAWRADGDTLRAQQALLGAARLAPEDPRPLLWLSDLLAERGEHDKAERVLEKARALEAVEAGAEEAPDAMGPEAADDLIAFAERKERGSQAAFSPRQVLFVVIALSGVALLIAGIAMLTSTADEAPPVPPQELSTEPIAIEPVEPEPPIARPAMTPEVAEPESEPPPKAVSPPQSSAPAAPRKAASRPRGFAHAAAQPTVKSKSTAPAAPRTKEPSAAAVQAELASLDTKQLTARGDALHAQGHTAIGASYYRRALEIDPDYAPALVGMGQSILRAKKYSDAMRNASRALQLARGVDARPGLEAVAIYQMGRVHYERRERDAARRLFRQSISLQGTPDAAWFYLGEALSSDNSPAARDAYEKYLELVPQGHLADRARRAIQ
jgi:tetratricopeptide (TPR) repeat protein